MALKYNTTTIPSSGTVKYNTTACGIVKYNTTEVWRKEEERTIATISELKTNQANYVYPEQVKMSSEYTIPSGFSQLIVTGTVGRHIDAQATYSGSTSIQIQGYNGSSWVNLKEYSTTSTDTNKNGDWSYSAAATIGLSGYSKCRLYMKAVANSSMGSDATAYYLFANDIVIKVHT